MKGEVTTIKVRYNSGGTRIARRITISKYIKLEELEYKIRERFDVSLDKRIEIYYLDDEGDHIAITFEEELALALESPNALTLELVVKPKIIDAFYTYPKVSKGSPGDITEVLVEDQWLTIPSATRNDTKAWGTHIYTGDSDLVKALVHTEKIELTDLPPRYNVIATLRFLPGCIKYIGSTSQGITTLNYGPYDLSYVIEDVRTVPL
ncbi:13530_t:CDS:2 [Acaulospora colombiana]|uniref:13530_t:CDS:1 n=1 Tax=Acaulospora colombiana TaxID=27376 RepID=A0ACA9MLJ7_9GLOM|nr:13530_t:CDS:2 [Acaulospora colombiana]